MSFRSWRPILFFKDCFDKFLYAWKLEELSRYFHRIKGLQRFKLSDERDHYKFDLVLRKVTVGGYAMLCVILRLLWHDGWWKAAPCWLLTTMSSGCFSWCSLLIPWKSKVTKTQWVSNQMVQTSWQLPASGSAWKWTSDHIDNEGVYHGGGASYGDEF